MTLNFRLSIAAALILLGFALVAWATAPLAINLFVWVFDGAPGEDRLVSLLAAILNGTHPAGHERAFHMLSGLGLSLAGVAMLVRSAARG